MSQGQQTIDISVTVNGTASSLTITPNVTVVELLRDELELTGTTEGCGIGVCGACTVLVDGEPINSCLEFAVNVNGKSIETIEGLGGEELSPVQEAFLEEEGFQCGYCTPGMIMMTDSLFREYPSPSADTKRMYMSENLCRCTGYESIQAAIETAESKLSVDD